MLAVIGAFAEFMRASIRCGSAKESAFTNQRGAYCGHKRVLSAAGLADARRCVDAGDTKAQIARELGISRETLYQYHRTAP